MMDGLDDCMNGKWSREEMHKPRWENRTVGFGGLHLLGYSIMIPELLF